MRQIPKRILLLTALLLPAVPGFAWTAGTRVRMADDAILLMPPSLRLALEGHREHLRRGLLTPMLGEDDATHRPPWAEGTLDDELAAAADRLRRILRRPTPFPEVAEAFGHMAHFVLDAGFPPGMSESDGDSRYSHFADFCESRRERFPLVFYGHDDPDLDGGDLAAFLDRVMQRARHEDRELARAYAKAGRPPDPAAFDDRSVPFAVGSLSYSRSVTDVVRVWLNVWSEAEGDTGRTPYMNHRAPGDGSGRP